MLSAPDKEVKNKDKKEMSPVKQASKTNLTSVDTASAVQTTDGGALTTAPKGI